MQRHYSRLLASALALSLVGLASGARAQLTADESKCQIGTSLAISKFITDKAKCLIKCEQGARKSLNPPTDCDAPFAGTTADCVDRATTKATGLEQSKCAKDCPECYGNDTGDCSVDATARVADAETQVDVLATTVFCDDSASPDTLNAAEAKCEDTVAKTLGNFAKKKLLCYSKCRKAEQKGDVPAGSCTPTATDPKTVACIQKEEGKATTIIDNKCADPPECFGTNTGATWVGLVEGAVDAGQASLYCASPSGAFIDGPTR